MKALILILQIHFFCGEIITTPVDTTETYTYIDNDCAPDLIISDGGDTITINKLDVSQFMIVDTVHVPISNPTPGAIDWYTMTGSGTGLPMTGSMTSAGYPYFTAFNGGSIVKAKASLCNIDVTYSDLVFEDHVLRSWSIIDWCSGSARNLDQYIRTSPMVCEPEVVIRDRHGDLLIPDSIYVAGDTIHYSIDIPMLGYPDFLEVSVLDLILIQRHILGLQELTGIDLEAADVNDDGRVSSLDLVVLRRGILGQIEDFPAGSYRLSQSELIGPCDGSYEVTGYKVGDVSTNSGSSLSDIELKLYQNAPNPFHGSTKVIYEAPVGEPIGYILSDISGNMVLQGRQVSEGLNTIEIDDIPDGVLLLRVVSRNRTETIKMISL